MKVAIIYNKDFSNVINTFGMQNKEKYNPKTVQMVAEALEAGGHNVCIIDGDMHVIEGLQSFMPKVLEGERMGMVFNMAYGIQGESRYTHLPSLLEMLGIPYVGSTPAGHALALDKVITKIVMQKHSIPTPNFWVFNNAEEDMDSVEYPVIVKPKMEAVSFGLKVVYNRNDLKDAVRFIVSEFQQQALVEQFIRGREFCVGLIGNNPIETFPVLEIDLEGDPDGIQTVDNKKRRPRRKICPADIPDELARKMIEWSRQAFQALGLRDFARVDIRLDEMNNVHILEINSMASLGKTGSYYHAAQVAGLDYQALVNKMLETASIRYFANTVLPDEVRMKELPQGVKIRGYLRSRQDNYEKILKKMVNLNSYVRNLEGVNTLGDILRKELVSLRFTCESYPQVEIGNILYFKNTDESPEIILIGNLDNNTQPSRQQYYKNTGSKVLGSGIWEHKGGLIILIGALQALRYLKKLRKIKIGVILTSDDAIHGKISKPIIISLTGNAKAVLGLHGSFLDGGVVTSRSGAASYNISMNLINTADESKVLLASKSFIRIVNEIVTISAPEEGYVLSPSRLSYNSNITEPYAHGEAEISVRYNFINQFELIDQKIRKLITQRKNKKDIDIRLEGGLSRPPMIKSPQSEDLYQKIKAIADSLDIRLLEEHRWSSADISQVENPCIIDGLGPIGIKPQKSPEYILSYSLTERMALLTKTLIEIGTESSE